MLNVRRKALAVGLLVLGVTLALMEKIAAAPQHNFDLVIENGRVMDPESGLDAVRNVGIRDGKVALITTEPITGARSIDAKGLAVAPGFIDMHQHGQEPRNYQYQAHDGVTTSLELEVGTNDVPAWYAQREGKSLINYGVSIGHIPVRMKVLKDPSRWLPTGDAANREATPEELAELERRMNEGLDQGALAVGMGINYTEAATHEEIVEMFRIAAKHGASVHVHFAVGGN